MISITVRFTSSGGGKGNPHSPVISDAGSISGKAEVHQALVHSGAAHTGDTLDLQWLRNGVAIDGATGDTHVVTANDDGAELRVRLLSSNRTGTTVAETEGVRATYKAPISTGDLAATVLSLDEPATLDFAAMVSGEGGGWGIASGGVPQGMTRSGGLISGTPLIAQPASMLTLRYTNSGGQADVSCMIAVRDASSIAAPTVGGVIGPRYVQENTGIIYASYATALSGEELTYSLEAPPVGVGINAASGVISFDTKAMTRKVDAKITIRATNQGGTATNSFLLTCGPQIGVVAPNNLTAKSANRASIIAAAKTMNCKHIRFDFVLPYVFSSATARNWGEPDDLYGRAVAAGITPLFVAKNLPGWAQNGGRTYQSYPDAANRELIAAGLKEAAVRYPLANWEFQNEQNHAGFAPQLDPEGYMVYSKACAAAIRQGNPSAFVISNGLTNAPLESPGSQMPAETFLERMYGAGAASVFDGIGDHPYVWPGAPGDKQSWNGWWIMANRLRPIMVAKGDGGKQIWMTEYGGPTGGGGTVWTEQQQAECTIAAWKLAAATGWAGPLFLYAVMDRGADSSSDTEDHYGLYQQDGVTPKATVAIMKEIKRGW